jgi:hypothetical protein
MRDPARLPITLDQGTVWKRRVSLRTGGPDGEPFDLSGCQLHAQIRENWNGPLVKQVAVAALVPEAGTFELVIDDRARELRRFDLFWDLLVTTPDGAVFKLMEGPVKVRSTITRRDAS